MLLLRTLKRGIFGLGLYSIFDKYEYFKDVKFTNDIVDF